MCMAGDVLMVVGGGLDGGHVFYFMFVGCKCNVEINWCMILTRVCFYKSNRNEINS